jgi:hypothetical protein
MTLNLALRLGAVTSAAFDPTSIAGCQLWVDAADASTFTYSSGTVVSQWNDKSGNAMHVSQGTVSLQPSRSGTVNGLSSVVFDGTDDFLSTTDPGSAVAQPQTVFAVVVPSLLTGSRTILAGVAGTVATLSTDGSTAIIYAGTANSGGGSLSTSTTYVIQATLNTTSSAVRVNGGTNLYSVNPGSLGYRGYRLGRYSTFTDYWNGSMCEIVVYDSALSLANINTVGQYLATKWGVTWSSAS